MAYSTPFTAVTGATITAASHNTGYRDNITAIWVYTAAGSIAYATSSTALAELTKGAANTTLRMNAGDTAPAWRDGVESTASSATPTPSIDTNSTYILTALAAGATFGAPSGTPANGQKLIIRIKDNGTAQSLAWNAVYRGIGCALPSTTIISKTLYVGFVYNSADTKWDCPAAIAQEA